MFQKVIATGRTTRNMDFKILSDGRAVANFNLAVNRKKNKNAVDFIPCVVWGDLAKAQVDKVGQGSLIQVEGEIRVSRYEENEGKNNSMIKLEVENVIWLDLKEVKTEQKEEHE